ncbi:MAG TPA: tol-pal system protein YbgF [Vicinamibacteria bacterium]|nr:tol-pal system protein YbgF [Vicinamibacteria bacterium]
MKFPRLVLAAVLLAGLAPSARAANKDMERLYVQIAALQGQIADMQRASEESLKEIRRLNEVLAEQNANLQKGVHDQRVQSEALQASVRELNEQISELKERMDGMRAQASAAPQVYTPTGGTPPPGVGGSLPPGASPPPPGTTPAPAGSGAPVPANAPPPRELYSQAYADYARGNYDLAIQEYREYLRLYPTTDFSDNAQYWIGECLYSKQRFSEAVEAWDELLRAYPSSDKLPDARLKKGMALERLGRRRDALAEYRTVVERYPNSEAGRKARERLSP